MKLKLHQLRKESILLMGDMNSDLLKRNGNEQIQHYGRKLKQLMNNFGLKNVITEPTRIAEASATLIDLILTSETSKITTSGTFDLALSDHKLVFAVVNLKRQKQQPKIAFVRNYKNLDIGKLKEEFDVAPWWICNTFEDVEDVTYAWETLYKNILNSFVKTRKAKIRSNSLPWMTSAIRKLNEQKI